MKVKNVDGNVVDVKCSECNNSKKFVYAQKAREYYEVVYDPDDIPEGLPIAADSFNSQVYEFEIWCGKCDAIIDIEDIDVI